MVGSRPAPGVDMVPYTVCASSRSTGFGLRPGCHSASESENIALIKCKGNHPKSHAVPVLDVS